MHGVWLDVEAVTAAVLADTNMPAVGVALAEALFVSTAQQSDGLTAALAFWVAGCELDRLGVGEVAGRVAREFGDHPDVAVARMRWCLDVLAGLV